MDGRVPGEDRAGAVAVVQVQVHHQDRLLEAAGPQARDRHRDVVEDAEAHPAVGQRVVEAAAEMDGDAAGAQGQAGGLDGPAHHEPLQVEDGFGFVSPNLDAQDAGEGPSVVLEALEVPRSVDAQQVLDGDGPRLRERLPRQQAGVLERGQDLLAAQRVEGDARDVLLVGGVVDDRHRLGPEPEPQSADRDEGHERSRSAAPSGTPVA